MWIATSNSFLSVVENRADKSEFVVRARVRGDLEKFFGEDIKVIETEDSDYRFRVFVTKEYFTDKMCGYINSIDYSNFKDSVKSEERKTWYTQIWSIMNNVQESLYGPQDWMKRYYEQRYKKLFSPSDRAEKDKFH